MKLIIDENLHQFTVDVLSIHGFEILTINDILYWGASDEEIYEYATRNNISLITHDRRFGQFHFEATDNPITTMILEVLSPHPEETNKLLDKALRELQLLSSSDYHNKLIIINQSKIRIRS